jgi:hypothetical protein
MKMPDLLGRFLKILHGRNVYPDVHQKPKNNLKKEAVDPWGSVSQKLKLDSPIHVKLGNDHHCQTRRQHKNQPKIED